MSSDDVDEAIQHVIATYARAQVANLNYLRTMAQTMTVDEIAHQLPGTNTSELAKEIAQAHKLAPVP